MNTTQPPQQRDLLTAAKIVFPVLFSNANGEANKYINLLSSERGENKEMSFELLLALIGSGKVTVLDAISAMKKYSRQDALRLGEAFAESISEDKDAISFMETVKADYPSLLGIVIKTRKWNPATIRQNLQPFMYTKELWLALAEMVLSDNLFQQTP